MGIVERRFKKRAKKRNMGPKAFMKHLISKGHTQNAVAKWLGCTRQAVGRIAKKYGLVFPGCEIDIEAVACEVWGETFSKHVKTSGDRYEDMAEQLGVSISTFKRRVKRKGIKRRTVEVS